MGLAKRIVVFFAMVCFVILLTAGWQFYDFKTRSIINTHESTFKIIPGTHVRKILAQLSEQPGVAPFSSFWFEVFIRIQNKATQIQAGEYKLTKGLSGQEFVNQTVRGDVLQYAITLVDGWTFKDIVKAIQKHPAVKVTLNPSEFNLAESLTSSFDVMNMTVELLDDQLRKSTLNPEGLFFPETYFFPRGTTDKEFLLRAYHLMLTKLSIAWKERAKDIAFKTPYEALILASIIERESGLPSEWPYISQVFHNRLKKKMRLQADPTVIYGLADSFTGDLKKSDLKKATPYNTYVIRGLPPTPIASPSFGALLAACNPASGDFLYFVAKGDGTHQFSLTLEEHQKWVKQYQKGFKYEKKS